MIFQAWTNEFSIRVYDSRFVFGSILDKKWKKCSTYYTEIYINRNRPPMRQESVKKATLFVAVVRTGSTPPLSTFRQLTQPPRAPSLPSFHLLSLFEQVEALTLVARKWVGEDSTNDDNKAFFFVS
jgi:hypothetical protein